MLITLQYLEESPELPTLSTELVIEKLKYAFDKLPITHLLIGWHVPNHLLEACKKECVKNKINFVRWQPLLTGDGVFTPKEEWQVTSLSGSKIPGFQNLPEFTFVCPNRADSTDIIFEHIIQLTNQDIYDGLFLDRIRYPSPASNPLKKMGCFCKSCHQKALNAGFDLGNLQKSLQVLTSSESGKLNLIGCLFGRFEGITNDSLRESIIGWLKFREESITNFVKTLTQSLNCKKLNIGLDCFSPSLTKMVGQDLNSLSRHTNWIKIMSYAHTLGPAGLPFEIIDFFNYIISVTTLKESEILAFLSTLLDLPLPVSLGKLQEYGLNAAALEKEILKGKNSVKIPVLAGLELVEIPGVATLTNDQIIIDHTSVLATGVAGLSISWDLWHIPNHRLDLISSIWLK
jgi:hypothetical protein